MLSYLELGLEKILLDDVVNYNLKEAFLKISTEISSINEENELLVPFERYNS